MRLTTNRASLRSTWPGRRRTICLETLRFCRRFLTQDHREAGSKFYGPKGRQFDQMTQTARSGRQNITEGSERSSTSKDTAMKLTDVDRASLSELRGD